MNEVRQEIENKVMEAFLRDPEATITNIKNHSLEEEFKDVCEITDTTSFHYHKYKVVIKQILARTKEYKILRVILPDYKTTSNCDSLYFIYNKDYSSVYGVRNMVLDRKLKLHGFYAYQLKEDTVAVTKKGSFFVKKWKTGEDILELSCVLFGVGLSNLTVTTLK